MVLLLVSLFTWSPRGVSGAASTPYDPVKVKRYDWIPTQKFTTYELTVESAELKGRSGIQGRRPGREWGWGFRFLQED